MRDWQRQVLFSSSVLEHVYDVAQAVSEMHRVLRPGGYVYAAHEFSPYTRHEIGHRASQALR
jgi:ubiquinone/menaquinone biosynthesis C-methylase UbiE